MAEKLPAAPMALFPKNLRLRAGDTGIDVPVVPSEYPEESEITRRIRERAEEKARFLLDDLLEMERQDVVMPGSYNAVIHVLTAVLVGKSAHAFSTEFWRLYGQVEAKWNVSDTGSQRQMEAEMTNRLQAAEISREAGFRDYSREGVTRRVPLPVFVRNVLAHQGTNSKNHVSHEDINGAIHFLAVWANE